MFYKLTFKHAPAMGYGLSKKLINLTQNSCTLKIKELTWQSVYILCLSVAVCLFVNDKRQNG